MAGFPPEMMRMEKWIAGIALIVAIAACAVALWVANDTKTGPFAPPKA